MDSKIRDFHAHVYYNADTIDTARHVCETANSLFPLTMGRMHEKPVGPHPEWSCQLAFAPENYADITTWLAMNRQGLTVFVHPETGDDLENHRDHAMWMGSMPKLKLDIFESGSDG